LTTLNAIITTSKGMMSQVNLSIYFTLACSWIFSHSWISSEFWKHKVLASSFPPSSVSRQRCSTDSTPACTSLYLRIVAALMKRIVAWRAPNRRAESWNAPCATLTCSTFHTNVLVDQITRRPGWCASRTFSPLILQHFFFSSPRATVTVARQFCLAAFREIRRPATAAFLTPLTSSPNRQSTCFTKPLSEEAKMFSFCYIKYNSREYYFDKRYIITRESIVMWHYGADIRLNNLKLFFNEILNTMMDGV